jgi:hypothetical protein
MRLWMGTRTLLGIGPDAMCIIMAKNLSTLCPYPETLWKAKFKGDRLNLAEEFSCCGMVIAGCFYLSLQ